MSDISEVNKTNLHKRGLIPILGWKHKIFKRKVVTRDGQVVTESCARNDKGAKEETFYEKWIRLGIFYYDYTIGAILNPKNNIFLVPDIR